MKEYRFTFEKAPNHNVYWLNPDDQAQMSTSQGEYFLHALGFESLNKGQKIRLRIVVEDA